jgi:hypothetical protein
MPVATLERWVIMRLNACFPPNGPVMIQTTSANWQGWFPFAISRAFAPDAVIKLATIEPPRYTSNEDNTTEKLTNTIPGEGDNVMVVSGADAVEALRPFSLGRDGIQFQVVTKVEGDDQVTGMSL